MDSTDHNTIYAKLRELATEYAYPVIATRNIGIEITALTPSPQFTIHYPFKEEEKIYDILVHANDMARGLRGVRLLGGEADSRLSHNVLERAAEEFKELAADSGVYGRIARSPKAVEIKIALNALAEPDMYGRALDVAIERAQGERLAHGGKGALVPERFKISSLRLLGRHIQQKIDGPASFDVQRWSAPEKGVSDDYVFDYPISGRGKEERLHALNVFHFLVGAGVFNGAKVLNNVSASVLDQAASTILAELTPESKITPLAEDLPIGTRIEGGHLELHIQLPTNSIETLKRLNAAADNAADEPMLIADLSAKWLKRTTREDNSQRITRVRSYLVNLIKAELPEVPNPKVTLNIATGPKDPKVTYSYSAASADPTVRAGLRNRLVRVFGDDALKIVDHQKINVMHVILAGDPKVLLAAIAKHDPQGFAAITPMKRKGGGIG